jgi:hypothetical protein
MAQWELTQKATTLKENHRGHILTGLLNLIRELSPTAVKLKLADIKLIFSKKITQSVIFIDSILHINFTSVSIFNSD